VAGQAKAIASSEALQYHHAEKDTAVRLGRDVKTVKST
jgi:hypothetical protein